MAITKAVFDIEQVEIQAASDMPGFLRMLANSIEAGEIDARVLHCSPHGMGGLHDQRAHVLVKLDLAAEIRKTVQIPEKELA